MNKTVTAGRGPFRKAEAARGPSAQPRADLQKYDLPVGVLARTLAVEAKVVPKEVAVIEKAELVLRTILIGAGATLTMDVWAFLLRKLGIPSLHFALLGRWIGHLPKGR